MTITVTQEGGRWIVRFPWSIETKDLVKASGCRFDGQRKLWWTDKPEIAAMLTLDDPTDVTKLVSTINTARRAAAEAQERTIDASRASTSDFAIPRSATVLARGWDFFPYQRAGVAFAAARRDTLIADEMGLGKTMQAIGLVNSDPTIENVLVICPASLKLNWAREAALWLSRPIVVNVVNGGALPAGGFCVTNYEMVQKQRQWIDGIKWHLLVVDECHYVKNPKAQRTHAILGKWDANPEKLVRPIAAARRCFLTGTPVLNRPVELWPLVHALDPQGLGRNWKGFVTRYCDGHQKRAGWHGPLVWDVTGASHLDELQAKLRSTIMVRRLKSEVLTELPAKRRQIIALKPETKRAIDAVRDEQKHVKETEEKLRKLRAELEALSADEASDAYKAAALRLREAESVAFTETSRVRHEVALAKIPQVVEHLTDCLEGSDGKLIVFAHHHDVIDELAQALAGFGVLKADGRDSVPARDAAVQAFQHDPLQRVIVCGITAMGVGHTMTAASHVVFSELDWTPGNLLQAEDRAHRIGQKDSVLVQHLVLDGSLDARMTELIVEKMGVIAAAIDDGARLPEIKILATPAAKPAGEPKPVPGSLMPLEQKRAVHAALRFLASVCDGAVRDDAQGFNGRDARFGHELAAQNGLSDRQAIVARKMIIKYRGQIIAGCGQEVYDAIKGAEEIDPQGK